VFILGLNMGTGGVGWATLVSQMCAVILCAVYLRKNYPVLRFKKGEMVFCRTRCGKLLINGVPMALQFSITAIGSIILQRAVNSLGVVVISAIGMASRVQILMMQPMEALGITMATFCAQNLGAGKLHRIKSGIKSALFIVVMYSVAAGLIVIFFGQYLTIAFVGRNAENLNEALVYIRQLFFANGIFYWSLGILFVLRNSIQGLGYSSVTVLAGVSELAARAGVAFAFVPVIGFNAVRFANPAAWLFADVILVVIFIIIIKKLSKIPRNELKNQ
jgi:Na+-driven multidrug efflux pump